MLFYHHDLSEKRVQLSQEESQHLIRVLRKNNGDQISITDGKGTSASAVISKADSKKCLIDITSKDQTPQDPFYLHIALAPTKNIDRTTWFVEKAIEIGIHEISFFECANSERKVIKMEKIYAKAISAMKQSLSYHLPRFNELEKFENFITNREFEGQKFIAHLENETTPELINVSEKSSSCQILIGPEGDFDDEEILLAKENGFKLVKMGNKRLRTETAALFACSLINAKNQAK